MDDLMCFALPTPFDVGPVNCYLFAGETLTLLDPGPASDETYGALTAALAGEGYDLADVERVLITHPHMDHYGIARQVKAESGAEVVAHADAVPHLEDPEGYFEREQAFFEPFLVAMGVPERTAHVVTGIPEPYIEFQEPVAVDRTLAEGDRIDDLGLDVLHTPGHAPGSVTFVGERVAFTGDHVLADITPNPLLTLAVGSEDERTRSLPTYLDSLRRLLSLDREGYAGHGEPIPDLAARAEATIAHHEERKEDIADILAETGPTTAYAVMGAMFPNLPSTEVFPGMCEVIGHLDLLEDEGRVEVTERAGVSRYALR
jgi:glyoxylase-like metal-dependent hydrolase (beta-lactamase superfamily II)